MDDSMPFRPFDLKAIRGRAFCRVYGEPTLDKALPNLISTYEADLAKRMNQGFADPNEVQKHFYRARNNLFGDSTYSQVLRAFELRLDYGRSLIVLTFGAFVTSAIAILAAIAFRWLRPTNAHFPRLRLRRLAVTALLSLALSFLLHESWKHGQEQYSRMCFGYYIEHRKSNPYVKKPIARDQTPDSSLTNEP
jgi:hypothetical protein